MKKYSVEPRGKQALHSVVPLAIAVAVAVTLTAPLSADEGMWPFNQFPREAVSTKHKFDVTPEFLDHLRLSSVRLTGSRASAGSGGLVSSNGLILTNQHLVAGCIGNSLADGFYATNQSAERKCEGLEAAVLMSIEDVTGQVKGALKGKEAAVTEKESGQALEQRNAAIARIEKECSGKGDRCAVVKLFSGGRYDLYRYKAYGDVRLVFAPENELAFFGRQRDSITYLRYGLDAAFLRAYENGKPAATPNFLKWNSQGVEEGDLVFAAGDPVSTNRLATAAQLAFYRDRELPTELPRLGSRIQSLTTYAAQSEANRKAAEPVLTELASEYKIAAGKLIGLRDDRLIARKTNFEGKVKRAAERDPKIGTKGIEVWDQVATAYRMWQPNERAYELLESHAAPGSVLFKVARELLRGEEPDMRAVDEGVETLLVAEYLDELKTMNNRDAPDKAMFNGRAAQDPQREARKAAKRDDADAPKIDKEAARVEDVAPGKSLLNGRSSKEVASEAIKGTALKDPAERRKLAGSKEAARKSQDPLMRLAAIVEDSAQRLRKRHDEVIGSLETSAAEKIAQYRFKLFGAAEYPDATGTPRVEFGVVKGYVDRAGVAMPFADTFSGLYYRANNDGPYLVPKRWVDGRGALNEVAALDFVSTCDVGGGDYGSPVVNRAGELVGVTFDGNLESLPDTFLYTDEQARAVHVSAQGIAEALGKVYKAQGLLDELFRGSANGAVSARVN
jgi:peptidase S46-like protein